MMNRIFLMAALLLVVKLGKAQEKLLQISFMPTYGAKPLIDSKAGITKNGKAIIIDKFKCYLTGFELWQNDKLVWKEKNSYHLLDIADPNSLIMDLHNINNGDFNKLKFFLGTDSLVNVSGAMAGDLDPSHGMYWAWNSGYINFKLEGRSEQCNTRNNVFQYHLGGYLPPYSTMQSIEIPIDANDSFTVAIDLEQFLKPVDFEFQPRVMLPGAESVELIERAAKIFIPANEIK